MNFKTYKNLPQMFCTLLPTSNLLIYSLLEIPSISDFFPDIAVFFVAHQNSREFICCCLYFFGDVELLNENKKL